MNTVLQPTAPAAFDAEKFKTTTRAQWQGAAEAWHRWGPFIGSWLGDATEAMFEMARVGPAAVFSMSPQGPASSRSRRRVASAPAATCS